MNSTIPFEVHITGPIKILKELESLNIKHITVNLLKPDLSILRTEYMSSFIIRTTYNNIHYEVLQICNQLSDIIRVKIECPPLYELFQMSIYMESHFSPVKIPSLMNYEFPISRNQHSFKLMATDREYSKSKYIDFLSKYGKSAECELCIFDSFKEEDYDWFTLYK